MSLPMFSHPWELLLNKIWWKSRRGMFEIFTPIFLFLQPRGRKIRSDTKKYISEWSSGYELYWGTWVFIPKWWDHMKKWLRKHDENHEVLEPRFPSLPSCITASIKHQQLEKNASKIHILVFFWDFLGFFRILFLWNGALLLMVSLGDDIFH